MLAIVIILFLYIMYQNITISKLRREIIDLMKVNTYGYDPTRRDP